VENKRGTIHRVKYWEIIADNLSKAGWNWGCVSTVDSSGRTVFVADAHCSDGKRFVVRADEELTTFVELESAVKLDRDKDTNWLLFDPNELQRFAQQKGMMRKRRGKVLKRLCRSSYYCGSRNSDRGNP
jgi:hypothetical protein